jgi:tetratricopeptide (TPR) repeat protein
LLKEKKAPAFKVSPEASFRRTQVLYQARLYDSALSEMDQLEGFPRETYPAGNAGESWIDEFYFQRGMISFWRKKFSQAEEAFQLVVRNSRQKETAEKAFYWRGRALERLGRGEEALKLAEAFPAPTPAPWGPRSSAEGSNSWERGTRRGHRRHQEGGVFPKSPAAQPLEGRMAFTPERGHGSGDPNLAGDGNV